MSYARLPTDSAAVQDELRESLLPNSFESSGSPTSKSRQEWASSIGNWTFYATLIAVLATIFNLSLLSSEVYQSKIRPTPPTRRPSTYIGFDQVVRNASSPQWPLKRRGFPEYFGLLDSRNPSTKFPNSKEVIVDPSHSVIMRFFAHDYGLEHCALASYFPREESLGSKTFSTEGDISALQVWLLKEPREAWSFLKPEVFSWSTKPSRQRLLGTLNVSLSNDTTPVFKCMSGSTILIEIACASRDCRTEFIQERPGVRLGFWLVQSEVEDITA